MEIKKTKNGVKFETGFLDYLFTVPIYEYAVHYKGFVSSGPDLGACIGRCYAAANQTI